MIGPAGAVMELAWDIRGIVPQDPGYLLYSAVCSQLGMAHADERWSMTLLGDDLRIRCALELIPLFVGELDSAVLRIGNSQIYLARTARIERLRPAEVLVADRVTIKDSVLGTSRLEPEIFARAVMRQVRQVTGFPAAVDVGAPSCGQVRDSDFHGYGVRVSGLQPLDSLVLQARGLGGRRRMGWGWLRPGRIYLSEITK